MSQPVIETIVIQPTPFCNIDCAYCYLPHRSDRRVVGQETIQALFRRVFDSGWANPGLTVIWHAGEPLVLPIAFYESAFRGIRALQPPSMRLRHSIQTNGMLLTPEWCDFLLQWKVGLGVSIDGPERLHDAYRRTRSGHGTFRRTLDGIRLLRSRGVPFHVITVLTGASLEAADELLRFYLDEGIEDVCFNVEESEGAHVSGLFQSADLHDRFRRFLDRFWREARTHPEIRFIREIDGLLPRIFRPDGPDVNNMQVEPFGMLNMDCHGNVSSFSPELLGLKNAIYEDFVIGNVLTDSLDTMRQSTAMVAMQRDITAGVDACRRNCGYFSVCGGGAPVNKLAENGSFRSERTAFCALTQILPTDLILAAVDRFAVAAE